MPVLELTRAVSARRWEWEYSSGKFEVEFMASGVFYCDIPQYQRYSTWKLDGDTLVVDWQDLGTYQMAVDVASKSMAGFSVLNEKAWRRARLLGDATISRKHESYDPPKFPKPKEPAVAAEESKEAPTDNSAFDAAATATATELPPAATDGAPPKKKGGC